MKLLCLALPGFSGVDRGWGKIVSPAGAELMDEAGGDGSVGWRKPPASLVEVMEEDGVEWGQHNLPWGKLADRNGR